MLQAAAMAGAAERHTLDIEAAPLADVLRAFSLQTGLLLGYLPFDAQMEALPRPALQGRFTADEALRQLLKGSGLEHHWVNDEMLAIGPAARVAAGAPPSAGPQAALPEQQSIVLPPEEITVWSQMLRPLDTDATRLVSLDRQRIDEIGAPTLPDLLRYVSQSAYSRPEGYRTSGAQYAELRGLGADTTLVLINGRRTFPSANSLSSSAFDLNTVPITAVERVDILLDSASVAHGTDAIGGVVNIVLRQRLDEPTVQLRYATAAGGAEQRRATLSGGFNNMRLNTALVLDAFELGGLHGRDRDRWRNQDFRRHGGTDQRSLVASPGNIAALPGEQLAGLASAQAMVPASVQGERPALQDYQQTAGKRRYQSLFEHWSIVPDSRRLSAMALGSLALDDAHHLHAELLYVRRKAGFDFLPPAFGGVTVPADNAFNVFGADVRFHGQLAGLSSQSHHIESDFLRSTLALSGAAGRWQWEVSALHSWERARSWLAGAVDGGRLMQAIASDDPAQALNVFGGPMGSDALLQGLLASPEVSRFSSGGTQLSATASAGVLELPAGTVMMTAGVEWRQERADFQEVLVSARRDVSSGYLQFSIPLLGRALTLPAMQALSLTIGARLDDYSDVGRVLRPQYGLTWMPHPALTLRASHGRSLRPPSLYELHFPTIAVPRQLNDPARGGESASVLVSNGGRQGLGVTEGTSYTLGLSWHPSPGALKVSADYWWLRMHDRLSLLPPEIILAEEARFADRIVRQSPASWEREAGIPGQLQAIDASRVNAGWLKTSGIDLAFSRTYETRMGTFSPRLQATWVRQFEATDIAGMPAEDRVGRAAPLGSITRWRAVASLAWNAAGYGASLVARHTPSYDDYASTQPTGRKVDAQTLLDIHGSVALDAVMAGGEWRQGLKITAGMMNALDEEPPFSQINPPAGYDPSHSDLKQRVYYLQLNKAF